MNFYDGKAMHWGSEIVKLLKEGDKHKGDKMALMYKEMMRLNDLVIECAAKILPYQTPRLESVEVKKTTEHRFVIAAPQLSKTPANWLNSVNEEAKMLPPPIKIIKEAVIEEDEDDYELKHTLGNNKRIEAQ
jgi:hypothetical protein